MEVIGTLTHQEAKDVGKLLRSKWYWPRFIISNSYGILLLGAVLWATVAGALSGDRDHRLARIVIWSVVAAIFCWATISTRRQSRREFRNLNASLPQRIQIDNAGVQTEHQRGRKSTNPWHAFKSWRTAGTAILLDFADSDGFLIVPLTALSAADRELLFGTIAQHIGPSSTMRN